MDTFPKLLGATFYKNYILLCVEPLDQKLITTELANSFEGGYESFGPIDVSLFKVLVDGNILEAKQVDMNKNAIITLSKTVSPKSNVKIIYTDPESDQTSGVLQDSEGDDARSANLTAEYTSGFNIKVLDGAELGSRYGVDDEEWFYGSEFGYYVSNNDEAGIQPETPGRVISVLNCV